MVELDFWDGLDNFEDNDPAPRDEPSLFEHNLFATEALAAPTAPTAPPASDPIPTLQTSTAHESLPPPPPPAALPPAPPQKIVSLATGALASSRTSAPRPWRGGSFLDDNCPLRRRVKVTITSDNKRKRPSPPSPPTAPPQPLKRARRMQTTLCFAPAGDVAGARFHLDIRKPAHAPLKAVQGAPLRVPPAPRAKTLIGSSRDSIGSGSGVTFVASPTKSSRSGQSSASAGSGRTSKAAKLAAATAAAAAKARTARSELARSRGDVAAAPRIVAGAAVAPDSAVATNTGGPLLTPALRSRLAAASERVTDTGAQFPLSSASAAVAVEAVTSAASAYKIFLGDDGYGRGVDDEMDLDLLSQLLES